MANCSGCSLLLTKSTYKKCTSCYLLFRKVNKKVFQCHDCKKEIGHQSKRCRQCSFVAMSGANHHWFGKSKSKEWKEKSSAIKIGERNPMWRGDQVGYTGLHSWVKEHFKKPQFCQDCKVVPPYDLANISQMYKRDLTDWEWLCRRCHMAKDGRAEKMRAIALKGNRIRCIILKNRPIDHGTKGYDRGCRCKECVEIHKTYNRNKMRLWRSKTVTANLLKGK